MNIQLYDYQFDAINRMRNGCILNGGVGSGKSRTALAYFYLLNGGTIATNGRATKMKAPRDLYIITTARKRDERDWDKEMSPFGVSSDKDASQYDNQTIVVDSWNNIKKYVDVTDSDFIFDEQRVIGNGVWVDSFLKITKSNRWVLLSATPGDTWLDYIPVFVANGFYKNRTDFKRQHVIYSRWSKFPKVDRYVNEGKLVKLRRRVLVNMDFERKTVRNNLDITVPYELLKYKDVLKRRWNIYKNEPIVNAGELCYVLRRVVNSDPARLSTVVSLAHEHGKVIIFYNFDYELELLKNSFGGCSGVQVAEWNGHVHQPIPKGDRWVYLVQYVAGAEGWNCVETDTIIFFSQNYSYRVMEQASGRIDRLNTPFKDLYYYHIKSKSGIDLAISKAIKEKRMFNVHDYTKTIL